MRSKITIAGHSVHPMLVGFPVAFYTATLVCYIVYNNNDDPFWFKVGVVANVAGVAMAGLAALPGFIDWLFIPSTLKAKRTGLFHMICNVLALVLYAIVAYMACDNWRTEGPLPSLAIPITALGFLLTLVAGFLGWAMVQKHHIGVNNVAEN